MAPLLGEGPVSRIPLWLADLRDTVSQPQVVVLYKRGLIDDSVIGGLEDYLACFKPDAHPPQAAYHEYDILKTYEGLHRQAAWEAQWRAKASQRARTSQGADPFGSANTQRYPARLRRTAHPLQAEGGAQQILSLLQRAQVQALLRQETLRRMGRE